jgi:hypothetical protein
MGWRGSALTMLASLEAAVADTASADERDAVIRLSGRGNDIRQATVFAAD